MAYATLDDLLVPGRFPRDLTGSEINQVETMMDDASFLLSVRAPGLQAAIDSGNEVITHAAMLMVVAMVRRALLAQAAQQTVDPAVDQASEAWGPFSRSIKYRSDSGTVFLYDSELEYLLGLLRGDVSEAVSMRSKGF